MHEGLVGAFTLYPNAGGREPSRAILRDVHQLDMRSCPLTDSQRTDEAHTNDVLNGISDPAYSNRKANFAQEPWHHREAVTPVHDRTTPAFLARLPLGVIVHRVEILDQAAVQVHITLSEGKPIRAAKQRARRCGNAAEIPVEIPGVILSGFTYWEVSCPA